MVYIKSPVVRGVFQLWKSLFELRNEGFFWGNGGVDYNCQSDFVFMLAPDNYFSKQSRPRIIWWAWLCFHYNSTSEMRSNITSRLLKGYFFDQQVFLKEQALGKRPCDFPCLQSWVRWSEIMMPIMVNIPDEISCPICSPGICDFLLKHYITHYVFKNINAFLLEWIRKNGTLTVIITIIPADSPWPNHLTWLHQ